MTVNSLELHAQEVIEQRAEKGEIPASVACKFLDDNAWQDRPRVNNVQ